MIAAIAGGVLGQVEGALGASGGLSSVTSLFTPTSTAPAQAATEIGRLAHGHGHRGGGLSDQLQSILLQQQSVDTPTIDDDVSETLPASQTVTAAGSAAASAFAG